LDRYLARGHCLGAEHDTVWLADYADKALTRAREELARQARELNPRRSWSDQLRDLTDHHPPIAEYYDTFGRVWEQARQAAIAHDLLTWPDYPITYVPIPRSDRAAAEGLYYLYYRCPAPLGRAELHHYLAPPVEPDMAEDEQERRLRAMNDATIKLNHVVHHGGIGHHVQNWHAFRAESRIGRVAGVDCASRIAMFCGGTLVEGWACYATDLMEEIGFLTPLESLAHQHGRVRLTARAVADVALHTGAMAFADVVAFFALETGMTAEAARAEAVRTSMFPGAALIYLVGTEAIHDLRRAVAARAGSRFSLRAFHDRFLSFGAIPVSLIAATMLASDGSASRVDS
jgi:hypothetical protein